MTALRGRSPAQLDEPRCRGLVVPAGRGFTVPTSFRAAPAIVAGTSEAKASATAKSFPWYSNPRGAS